jgi:hypothetical protein
VRAAAGTRVRVRASTVLGGVLVLNGDVDPLGHGFASLDL